MLAQFFAASSKLYSSHPLIFASQDQQSIISNFRIIKEADYIK